MGDDMLVTERDTDPRLGVLPVRLRPYRAEDFADVVALLRDLPGLYPNGDQWLAGRLADVLYGRAQATVAILGRDHSVPVGITIETPKGAARAKLSTLFVAPLARGCGVGRRLMTAAEHGWQQSGIRRVHVTADLARADEVERTVGRHGFRRLTVEPDRYGPGRDEAIFVRGA
jgi:GNAT superfamily N-acetyltransferase